MAAVASRWSANELLIENAGQQTANCLHVARLDMPLQSDLAAAEERYAGLTARSVESRGD